MRDPQPTYDKAPDDTLLFAFEGTAAVTASQVGQQPCREAVVQNKTGSPENLLVGNSVKQVIVLSAGQAVTVGVPDVSLLWVRSVAGTATWGCLALN